LIYKADSVAGAFLKKERKEQKNRTKGLDKREKKC
jgi:hypothetical protein